MNSLLLGLLAILCLLPIAHVIALSLSDSSEVASGHVALLPRGITLDAYRYVMENRQFWNAFFVTLRRVVIGVSISLILVVLTAYPLSKPVSRFHGRPFFFLVFYDQYAVFWWSDSNLHVDQPAWYVRYNLGSDAAWRHECGLYDYDDEFF